MWIMESPPGAETTLNGRKLLYFAGTGYLGLQGHPEVIAAAQAAAAQCGVHSATSRNGFGTTPYLQEVERRAAEFMGAEAALYVVTGYAGNFAIAAALRDVVNLVFVDEIAHDCLKEAMRWFDALAQPPIPFRHRDAGHLRALLREHVRPGQRISVLSDGVFPMSGRIAPVAEYLEVLAPFDGSMLHIDDAHGVAALGKLGRGSLELAGVAPERINSSIEPRGDGPLVFCSATLSKAIGGHGGLIAGSRPFLECVRRGSGWFRGASAPAAPVAGATAKALEIVQRSPELRQRLAANVAWLRAAFADLGLPVEQTPSPVIGIALDRPEPMENIQRRLLDEGIAVAYTRDYAGAGPHGTLRIAVFATHTEAMLQRLVDAMRRALDVEQAS